MKDFSQTGEQGVILEWAKRHGPGRFLDVGATDGITASNTRALALNGWNGVCVEPAAWAFAQLAELYKDTAFVAGTPKEFLDTVGRRPRVECVQAAIVSEPGLRRFHYVRDLVSTTEDRYAEIWQGAVSYQPVLVAGVTMRQLLDGVGGDFSFVSIDTEGTTLQLLDELRAQPEWEAVRLLCVEAEDGGDRWTIQQLCLEGWARLFVSPNNVILERL